jgi:hypothetical protein
MERNPGEKRGDKNMKEAETNYFSHHLGRVARH